MIRIVTDSTCDLPAEALVRHRITVVPINIQFGQESYQEGVTMNAAEFYRRVETAAQFPTTSQPSLGQFQAAYRALDAEPDTDAVLSIHITSHLSGTFSSAEVAAGQLPSRTPIMVFDSLSGSMGLGFMVLEAAHMAEEGRPMPDILARLEVLRQRMRIFLALQDLRYARLSGRVGAVQAMLASLLRVTPVLAVEGGELVMAKRVRSRAQGLVALADLLADAVGSGPVKLAVVGAEAPQQAQAVRHALEARLHATEVIMSQLSIGIAVHLGPGTVGVVAYAEGG